MQHLVELARKVQGEFALSEGFYAGSVAAALQTTTGDIYTGICLDLACGIGFCAEHAAIAEMLKDRQTHVVGIVAVSEEGILPPCGRCRELLFQVDRRNLSTQVMVAPDNIVTLQELLPYPWL